MGRSREPDHFHGGVAEEYEAQRQSDKVWQDEQAAVESFVGELAAGSRCIDVPVGTGRFFPFYARHDIDVTGVDVSADMLSQAQAKASALEIRPDFVQGSIMRLPFGSGAFDAAVCVRMLTWFDGHQSEATLSELARVCEGWVLVSLNVRFPITEVARAGRLRDLVGVVREKRRSVVKILGRRARGRPSLRIHSRDALLEKCEDYGLSLAAEWVLREDPGARRYVVWILQKTPTT